MARLRHLFALFSALALAVPEGAVGHEYWVEPVEYSIAPGETLRAELKNGEDFKGVSFPYLPQAYSRFEIATPRDTHPVEGRMGDRPAAQIPRPGEGLATLVIATKKNSLTYTDFAKFERFLDGKGLGWALEAHRARGLPEDRVVESYYRYAKALVAVGDGAGSDTPQDLPIELVAETNPYTDPGPVRLQLLASGAPLPNWDVQIFHRPDRETPAVKRHVTTDAAGRVAVPAEPGEYLINAVDIGPPRAADLTGPPARQPHWESRWASLTYRIPAR